MNSPVSPASSYAVVKMLLRVPLFKERWWVFSAVFSSCVTVIKESACQVSLVKLNITVP